MPETSRPLPDFANPPLVEVALSVQFERLSKLRTLQLGVLWQEYRKRFPLTEEHAPLDAVVEQFGMPTGGQAVVQFEMLENLPTPRCWFLNDAGTELIQVQNDRFIHNWRKAGTDEAYPRYEKVRGVFETELRRFEAFIQREKLGDFIPTQCEVTYVNHIVSGETWRDHGDVAHVIAAHGGQFSDDFFGPAEEVALRLRFLIPGEDGKPQGRLHAVIEPRFRSDDHRPLFVLNLTARGRPLTDGTDGVFGFLDVGREWVVRGFAALTTPIMHKEWGRQDGAYSP